MMQEAGHGALGWWHVPLGAGARMGCVLVVDQEVDTSLRAVAGVVAVRLG